MKNEITKEGSLIYNKIKLNFNITFLDLPGFIDAESIEDLCDKLEIRNPGLVFANKNIVSDLPKVNCLIIDNNENGTRQFVNVISGKTLNFSLVTDNHEIKLAPLLDEKHFDIVFLSKDMDWHNTKFKSINICRDFIVRRYGVNVYIVLTSDYELPMTKISQYIEKGFDYVLVKSDAAKRLDKIFVKAVEKRGG